MTDCGCRKGAFRPGCERHDPGASLTAQGRISAVLRQFEAKIVAWYEAAKS